ncbi:MAG: DegT/DnrJ/EryC1/StrS family aminotransferase [Acidobacteriaceae bacterium]|nr:DegT/DnrJ/EryC1/StrS family aminotransferase [Acidobacteriaceae bacterium]
MPELALLGGSPIRTTPFSPWPIFDDCERGKVRDVLESGKWGHLMSPADKVTELERVFAEYYGVKYAIAVSSGSVALEAALRTARVTEGDEVITTPTTWVAPALAAVMVGADPAFVDIRDDSYCIDPALIEAAITPRTKAIVPVHLGGYLCDMRAIVSIAKRHNLTVIEDCAQAHGSRYESSLAGTFGDFGCFSFEATKLMTSGEGGMVITNNDDFAEYLYCFTHAGVQYANRGSGYPKGRIAGWNMRITEFQAVLLMCQLSRLEEHRERRSENAVYLGQQLKEIPGIAPLPHCPGQNFYSYMFKFDSNLFSGAPVQAFRAALRAEGIPCYSSASHQFPVYRSHVFLSPRLDYSNTYCPVAERAFESEAVGLQATWTLLGSRHDMDDVVAAVKKIHSHSVELRQVSVASAGPGSRPADPGNRSALSR